MLFLQEPIFVSFFCLLFAIYYPRIIKILHMYKDFKIKWRPHFKPPKGNFSLGAGSLSNSVNNKGS